MPGDLRHHCLREGCYRIAFLPWPRSCKSAATRASKNSQTFGFICIGIVAAQATPLAATKIPNATERMPRQLTQSQTNCRADALDHSAFRHSQFSLARSSPGEWSRGDASEIDG